MWSQVSEFRYWFQISEFRYNWLIEGSTRSSKGGSPSSHSYHSRQHSTLTQASILLVILVMLDDRDLLIANIASVMGAHYVRREFHRAKRARLRMQRRFIVLSTFLCAIFAMLVTSPSSRRYWIRFRSVHFAYGVRDGTLLHGREFAETFRMTKASFRKLFGIIGMSLVGKLLTDSNAHI